MHLIQFGTPNSQVDIGTRLEVIRMLFLVRTDSFPGLGPEIDLEKLGPLAEHEVIPSLETLIKLRNEGKILAGGTPAGDRAHVFIVDAASNEEVTGLIQALPFWGRHKWQVTPLESWDHHVDFLRGMLAKGE